MNPLDQTFSSAAASLPGKAYPGGPDLSYGRDVAAKRMALQGGLSGVRRSIFDMNLARQKESFDYGADQQNNPGLFDLLGLGVSGANFIGQRDEAGKSEARNKAFMSQLMNPMGPPAPGGYY